MKKPRKNLFTYSPNHFFTKPGFTLAEVLIVISIIGVVAALTIPTLMTNFRAKQIKTQVKKNYSLVNQAGKLSTARFGFSYGDSTECSSLGDNPEDKQSICAIFNGTLTGHSMIDGTTVTVEDYPIIPDSDGLLWDLNNVPLNIVKLSSGAYIIFDLSGFPNCNYSGDMSKSEYYLDYCMYGNNFLIDINGSAGPNKFVKCSNTSETKGLWQEDYAPCVVKNKDFTDIYQFFVMGNYVIPYTNATEAVLNN